LDDANDPWGAWRGRIKASRARRDERLPEWQTNVDARKGARSGTDAVDRLTTNDRRIIVNQDWPITKAKIAQLYSQTPEVRLTPRDDAFRPAVPVFGRELNDTIAAASVGTTIEEVLADVVNASGIGAALVSCEARTEMRDVPMVDPAMVPPELQAEIPTQSVEHTVDRRFLAQRISPADLLTPDDFTGSDYDQARWLGEDGRMTWPQSMAALGLTEEQKEKVCGKDKRAGNSSTLNTSTATFSDTDVVNYTQLFYWRHYYHADETNFKALQRLVFVEGLEEPVINEPYQAQKKLEDGRLVGVTKNPIRVLTLTYVSDDSLPPSDCSIARAAISELEQSRDAMVQQRKHSIPFRWGDTNRISSNMRAKIDQGEYQGFIWTNGPGDRAIGEVARASFPQEKFEFDKIIKGDITEQTQVGTNQNGDFASGERSAREAGIIEKNFQRRVGQEQDKVTKFFIGIAEVLAGHLALYGTFDLPDMLGEQREVIANAFTYSVKADSTVRKDVQQRIEELKEFYNFTAQTGYLNPEPLLQEWAELIDAPDGVIVPPQPKPPEPVKISVSKAEDLQDQLFVALLVRTNQAPSPEDMAAAAQIMASRLVIPDVTAPAPEVEGGDVETPGIAHPERVEAPRVNKRDEDGGA
jgi:hypothetical protein